MKIILQFYFVIIIYIYFIIIKELNLGSNSLKKLFEKQGLQVKVDLPLRNDSTSSSIQTQGSSKSKQKGEKVGDISIFVSFYQVN